MSDSSGNVTLALTEVADAAPDRPALICGPHRFSFSQLDRVVGQASVHFAAHGVRRGATVPVSLTSQVDTAIAVLGILRLGAAAMPLPPRLERAQRRALMHKAGARFQVLGDPTRAEPGVRPIHFDLTRLPGGEHRRLMDVAPEELGLILVGSGSTGEPRLLPLSHTILHARNAIRARGFGMLPGERFMLVVPMFFASPITWFLATVTRGLTCITWHSAMELAASVTTEQPDYLHITVLHAHRLLAEASNRPGFDLSQVKQVSISASPISEALRKALKSRLKARLAINYGSNETGTLTTAFAHDMDRVPDTVGQPLSGNEVQIVDPEDHPLGPGDIGEIRARGPGIIDGYVGGGDTDRFRGGWFYPGDLGRWQNGQLVHCGRSDQMMIVDGINVYPAEIERCLERHPAIDEIAAFPVPHHVHGDVPVCAVTLKPGLRATPGELMALARRELGPGRPHRILITDSLPRNTQGKLIRTDLVRRMMKAR